MSSKVQLPFSSRASNLRDSFKLAIRPILTACQKEEFYNVFSTFSNVEQKALHKLFMQVITSMHESMEEEFESICKETQVIDALDAIDVLVEKQSNDILQGDGKSFDTVKEQLTRQKKDEILYLKSRLERVENQNKLNRARLESLNEGCENLYVAANVLEKNMD
ncbi:uncharacterized protein LOC105421403 isoform X2 [Amborella trichopoda]|uniref:uncharacterized protein LOC105421403 isoform X2 n=1 Tax=Amborella trichopoda TaxID=13333 RepID=UPI0009BF6C05|nr:uncharacterized protein LOC105421403 isoform X2 [Amborella trichopoda]|eukprot:XP_020528990.1 uncharacterized protein LOC105421403 isoform X2 [Amborella trichopoda]